MSPLGQRFTAVLPRVLGGVARSTAATGVRGMPQGTFRHGTLYIKPGVDLRADKNAVLKSTTHRADFRPIRQASDIIHGRSNHFVTGTTSENSHLTALKELVVGNTRAIDTGGLTLHVSEGPPIVRT